MVHPLIYSSTHDHAPGQKYPLLMHHVVSLYPGCPANGPLCQKCIISCLRFPSGGMTRHPLLSFQNGSVGICMASMRNISSHCFRSDAYSFCVSVIWCDRDLFELALNTLMNVCSGIIIMSWLSSLPSSVPDGLKRASAVVCVFSGVCSRTKW